MAKRELVLDFEADGTVRGEANGFEGRECEEVLAQVLDGLGQVVAAEKKPDYFKAKAVPRRVAR